MKVSARNKKVIKSNRQKSFDKLIWNDQYMVYTLCPSRINQQIRQDQNHASNPDTKRPFRSRSDACRRLLRYHVFQNYRPTDEELRKFDEHTEDMSQELLRKKDWMFDKFRNLLLQESLVS